MKKVVADRYRSIDFARAKRGPVVKPVEPGKTKISIRLDNTVLQYFRDLVDKAGGGNHGSMTHYSSTSTGGRLSTSCGRLCGTHSAPAVEWRRLPHTD